MKVIITVKHEIEYEGAMCLTSCLSYDDTADRVDNIRCHIFDTWIDLNKKDYRPIRCPACIEATNNLSTKEKE